MKYGSFLLMPVRERKGSIMGPGRKHGVFGDGVLPGERGL